MPKNTGWDEFDLENALKNYPLKGEKKAVQKPLPAADQDNFAANMRDQLKSFKSDKTITAAEIDRIDHPLWNDPGAVKSLLVSAQPDELVYALRFMKIRQDKNYHYLYKLDPIKSTIYAIANSPSEKVRKAFVALFSCRDNRGTRSRFWPDNLRDLEPMLESQYPDIVGFVLNLFTDLNYVPEDQETIKKLMSLEISNDPGISHMAFYLYDDPRRKWKKDPMARMEPGESGKHFYQRMKKAAESGDPKAQYDYARCNSIKYGIAKPDDDCTKYFLKAAEQGYVPAQYQLGSACFYQDNEEIQKGGELWMLKAAEKGYAPAQYSLGKLYSQNGSPVKKDLPKAIAWYTKAAEGGYLDAQMKLGEFYREGEVVPKNLPEARKWFQMAADQGYELAIDEVKAIDKNINYQKLGADRPD